MILLIITRLHFNFIVFDVWNVSICISNRFLFNRSYCKWNIVNWLNVICSSLYHTAFKVIPLLVHWMIGKDSKYCYLCRVFPGFIISFTGYIVNYNNNNNIFPTGFGYNGQSIRSQSITKYAIEQKHLRRPRWTHSLLCSHSTMRRIPDRTRERSGAELVTLNRRLRDYSKSASTSNRDCHSTCPSGTWFISLFRQSDD